MTTRHETERGDIYPNGHIVQGSDEPEKYSNSSTGSLDDTTGWSALESNWNMWLVGLLVGVRLAGLLIWAPTILQIRKRNSRNSNQC